MELNINILTDNKIKKITICSNYLDDMNKILNYILNTINLLNSIDEKIILNKFDIYHNETENQNSDLIQAKIVEKGNIWGKKIKDCKINLTTGLIS